MNQGKQVQACTALNLSDESQCHAEATSVDGLFCSFHARQCYGLYRGYKIRNAKLDALDSSPPQYLADSKTSLRNESFSTIDDEETLSKLHTYLFKKHALLERLIRARKLHHSRFYSLSLDYGHKAYLDKLTNDKFVVLRALERLERRTAEILYKQQKWFKWVRERQDEEESARIKESEMIKKEAKLFKRHWKQIQSRLAIKKQAEEAKRQEAFLDEAYQERSRQKAEEESEGDDEWDPIEDEVEDDRASFVDLLRGLLWLPGSKQSTKSSKNPNGDAAPVPSGSSNNKENMDPGKNLSKNARKRAKAKVRAAEPPKEEMAEDDGVVKIEVNETREEMRKRLVDGVSFTPGIRGELLVGTMESPAQTIGKVPGIPEEEVEKILEEVSDIKLFLFCRLLLSQAAILPAALKSGSVGDFLVDPEVSTPDLRDLCLRIEQPSLQEIRDACADFFRGADIEPDLETMDDQSEDEEDPDTKGQMKLAHRHMPLSWRSKQEEGVDAQQNALRAIHAETDTTVDFGVYESDGQFKSKRVRVRVCGKTIWNYPSNEAMTRGGWLHYSIIAKGSRLADAIELCRNWNEFWDLNVLAIYRYFPSPHWEQWAGDLFRQQLLQLGFIPYLRCDQAEEMTVNRQAGGRGQGPRVHAAVEFKNVVAGHIKRNDPVSRRFLQYLAMRTDRVVLLVRDGKTGKLLVTPPAEHSWIVRQKAGTGRAARNEWEVTRSVNEDMFEQISGKKMREWQFGFTDFYDVIVWDLLPGKPFTSLYSSVQECIIKAHRCCEGIDIYRPMASTLKTLVQEKETGRTRDAKEGETSMWDVIEREESKVVFHQKSPKPSDERRVRFVDDSPPDWLYSDIDATEDLVLFPEEAKNQKSTKISDRTDGITKKLERAGPNMKRFIYDMPSDSDEDDYVDSKVDIASGNRGAPLRIANANEVAKRDPNCTCDKCRAGEWELCEAWEDSESEDEFLFDTDDGDPRTMAMALAFESLPPPTYGEDPEKDFWLHMDREKSKVFKQAWHDAVLDPKERARYSNISSLMKKLNKKSPASKEYKKFGLKILLWLRVHYGEHRRVATDIERAVAAMSIYFDSMPTRNDLDSVLATLKGNIQDNSFRATEIPYSRTFRSNLMVSATFWRETDAVFEERKKAWQRDQEGYQRDWDAKIRPMVAHWFKAGVIAPAHLPYPPGRCAVQASDNGQPELYMDFRSYRSEWPNRSTSFPSISDPFKVNLLQSARQWHDVNPKSRFALLRLWTDSHFYPLMLGYDNRDSTSFEDEIGRSWEWKFIPRDMPGSEWNMQKALDKQLDPFRGQLGKQIVTKRDMVLVMGANEDDLKRYAVGTAFALQTKPWRLEIDLWKSFVNVDLAFLEALSNVWLE